MSSPNIKQICQLKNVEDGSNNTICNIEGATPLIYNGLEKVPFNKNDLQLFSSATDPSLVASSHTHYLQEVRQIYSFLDCPDPYVQQFSNDPSYQSNYGNLMKNTTCQRKIQSTVYQDPCNPGGIFPNTQAPLGASPSLNGSLTSSDELSTSMPVIQNFYCKSGSPQKKNLMFSSIPDSISEHMIDEEADLKLASEIGQTKESCENIKFKANLDGQNGAKWIDSFSLKYVTPNFKIQPNDIQYEGVTNTLSLSNILPPTKTPNPFKYTIDPHVVRGSLSQAELACRKETNCKGFLLSKDLKTSYLITPTVTPSQLTTPGDMSDDAKQHLSDFVFYYEKNTTTQDTSNVLSEITAQSPSIGKLISYSLSSKKTGMCIPEYYDCSAQSLQNESSCNAQSKCVWAQPISEYPSKDANVSDIVPIDKPGCYPLDYSYASTVLDTSSVLLSKTVKQNLLSPSGDIVWYNENSDIYKAPPSMDMFDFKIQCDKVGGKTIGVQESNRTQNNGQVDLFSPTLAPSNIQYYCVPKTEFHACGLANNRGEPVQCCNGPIINTKDNLTDFDTKGPICIGGGHPLAPMCQQGNHKNSPDNTNNLLTPAAIARLTSPTCTSPSITEEFKTMCVQPFVSPTCTSPSTTDEEKDNAGCIKYNTTAPETYEFAQAMIGETYNDGKGKAIIGGNGWTYQSQKGNNSQSDPNELIYPGGAGELITNNPLSCWYNEDIMMSGTTPDNPIMSQFRNRQSQPVLRAGSTLRNDSCWAYKPGWKSGQEISPIDETGFRENYTPGPYNQKDYVWTAKPMGWSPDVAEGQNAHSDSIDITSYLPSECKWMSHTAAERQQKIDNKMECGGPPGSRPKYCDYELPGKNGQFPDTPEKTKQCLSQTMDALKKDGSDSDFDAQPNPVQQLFNGGWTGGMVDMSPVTNQPHYDVTQTDGHVPTWSLSWLGGCNALTTNLNAPDETYFNTHSYSGNACGNQCGGNCVMCNNWPENQVAGWSSANTGDKTQGTGERKKSYVPWLPCKLNKSVSHLPTTLLCRNCGPLSESGVPNLSNHSSDELMSTYGYSWYPEWKLVGGVNGMWMQSSDGLCNATKHINTSQTGPQYPQLKVNGGPALLGSNVKLGSPSEGDSPSVTFVFTPQEGGLQVNGSKVMENNINSQTYKDICQTYPSDNVHIPYALLPGTYPNPSSPSQAWFNGQDEDDIYDVRKTASYGNAYPGTWCITSIDQVSLRSRTGALFGPAGTTHLWKMFSIGISTRPDEVTGTDTSFPFASFTQGNAGSVWTAAFNSIDCGNQAQWDNDRIRKGENSRKPLSQQPQNIPYYSPDIASGGFMPKAHPSNWYGGGGGYNARAGVIQQDGGSCTSGRMMCNNSYNKNKDGSPLDGDPQCVGGANYNIGTSYQYAGSSDSPFGGTYMCWPENDYTYVGSGYAQNSNSCNYNAPDQATEVTGMLESKDNSNVSLPVSSSKSCQVDADCQHIGSGCMWSEINEASLFPNVCPLQSIGTVSASNVLDNSDSSGSNQTVSACLSNYGAPKNKNQWKYGDTSTEFASAGRWPIAGVNAVHSSAYCHKPTNSCITKTNPTNRVTSISMST